MYRKAGRSLRRDASGLGADEEHGTFLKFCLKTKFPICSSSIKGKQGNNNNTCSAQIPFTYDKMRITIIRYKITSANKLQ